MEGTGRERERIEESRKKKILLVWEVLGWARTRIKSF